MNPKMPTPVCTYKSPDGVTDWPAYSFEQVQEYARALLSASKPAAQGEQAGWCYPTGGRTRFADMGDTVSTEFADAMRPVYYAAAPAQSAEPVAWMVLASNTRKPCEVTLHKSETEALRQDCVIPLCTAPQPSPTAVEADGTKRFPTPVSISTDKICELAGKYNLGNPRIDALRGFVNEVIIVNEAEYAKSE